MTSSTLRVALARAIYEGRNGRGCRVWSTLPREHRVCYLGDADAALAVIRAHCLGRVREIHSRIHMTDSDAFAEQVRQRALVAWQLAEDCNTTGSTDGR